MAAKKYSFVYELIDLFADTAAILISIVSNSYYGMPRGQIHFNLPPEHPIMSFETIEIKMAAVSAKRFIRLTSLVCMYKIQKKCCLRARLVSLIST